MCQIVVKLTAHQHNFGYILVLACQNICLKFGHSRHRHRHAMKWLQRQYTNFMFDIVLDSKDS